ncbi:MAG: HD domain-containing protein [Oligoflexia bacterium]|nr:HD domain-containing protein [Oligoflexia bacterium]MBF0364544.1 HD domain-containing protein [Oligoflexia bacterium]
MQKKKQFVSELQIKDSVDTTFLVKHIAAVEGRDGRPYLNIVLSDNSGDIEGRAWSHAKEICERIIRGNLAHIKGKINLYQGRRQLIVQEIKLVENSHDFDDADYRPRSSRAADEMFARLEEVLALEVRDVYIKELLTLILKDGEIARRLLVWPAGKTVHHAYQSGLMEHILSCAEMAIVLSKHYHVKSDYVIAGAILHDLCKIYEISDGNSYEYTDEGKLIGHVAQSLELVDCFALKIKHFPKTTKMHLKHILLAHHGEYAYGAPKLPVTKEAFLVHFIDLMDSKMGAVELVTKSDPCSGNWSGFVKHLDRIIFKGELPTYGASAIAVEDDPLP